MTNNKEELPEKVVSLDDIMNRLSPEIRKQVEENLNVFETPSGYLNYTDVCILWGDHSWGTLDPGLAKAIARELTKKHNLPVLETGDGKFLINYNAARVW